MAEQLELEVERLWSFQVQRALRNTRSPTFIPLNLENCIEYKLKGTRLETYRFQAVVIFATWIRPTLNDFVRLPFISSSHMLLYFDKSILRIWKTGVALGKCQPCSIIVAKSQSRFWFVHRAEIAHLWTGGAWQSNRAQLAWTSSQKCFAYLWYFKLRERKLPG